MRLLLAWMIYSPFNIRYRTVSGFKELLSPISHKSIEIPEEIGAVKSETQSILKSKCFRFVS